MIEELKDYLKEPRTKEDVMEKFSWDSEKASAELLVGILSKEIMANINGNYEVYED